jgi:hypothetical protein
MRYAPKPKVQCIGVPPNDRHKPRCSAPQKARLMPGVRRLPYIPSTISNIASERRIAMQKNRLLIWFICLGVWLAGCQPLNIPNDNATATAPAGWIFYQHPQTGLSFYYPPDVSFNISENPSTPVAPGDDLGQAHAIYLAHLLHRPEGQPESIDFYLLSNPSHWSLDDFIVAHSADLFAKPDTTLPRGDILSHTSTFEIQGQTAMRVS